MDEETNPHGVLEEVEACPNKMEESAEIRDNGFQRGNTGELKKGLLANRRKPDNEYSPPKREA